MGGPGPDLKGQGPGREVAGPALLNRAEGQLMFELALGSDPGRTQTGPFGDVVTIATTTTTSSHHTTTHLTTITHHHPSSPSPTPFMNAIWRKMQDSGHKVCPPFFLFFMFVFTL